jgi:protein-tyrosine phosphatase
MAEEEHFPEDDVSWITSQVAVTNFVTAHGNLRSHGISAVLCLDRSVAGGNATSRGLQTVEVVDLHDGANPAYLFAEAVNLLCRLNKQYEKVLVHCRAGKSRSIAVVAAWLARDQNIGWQAALKRVIAARQTHSVAPELMELGQALVESGE